MCGRFSLISSAEILKNHFKLTQGLYMTPRYNIAPGQQIPIQIQAGSLEFYQWGLKPAWMWEKIQQKPFINVRAETILEKPLFKQSFAKRRCLIPSDGFFEWKTLGRFKQPYYIHRKDKRPFALAGIYENETVSIITTQANSLMQTVHERMPVIISEEHYNDWLNPGLETSQALALLTPSLSESWNLYPVSREVNRADFDNALCIKSLQ